MMLEKYPAYQVHIQDALTYAGNLENLADISRRIRASSSPRAISAMPISSTRCAKKADIFVNFAVMESHVRSLSILNPGEFIQTDVAGVYILLESCARRLAMIPVSAMYSTDEVYRKHPQRLVQGRERSRSAQLSPYSASKSRRRVCRCAHFTRRMA